MRKLVLYHWEHGNDLNEVLKYSKINRNTIYVCSDADGIVVNEDDIKLIGNVISISNGEVI